MSFVVCSHHWILLRWTKKDWRYEILKEWNNVEKPAFDERTEVQKSVMKVYVWASSKLVQDRDKKWIIVKMTENSRAP
jgi:hypothetical protein